MDLIAIVIPIYNRVKITEIGLTALFKAISQYQSLKSNRFEILVVVVDDGSSDGSAEVISSRFPMVHLLFGDGNLWWTGSVNKGARYAIEELNADYLLLWNDDVISASDYFLRLEEILYSDEMFSRSILVSKIFWQDNPTVLFNFGCFYNPKTGNKELIGSMMKDQGQFDSMIEVDWSGGMGTLIPAHVLKKVDYFDDENFPQYHGDSDFFLRAKKAGTKVFAIPTLVLYNNRDSSGIKEIRKISDIKKMFFSNRSNYNLSQNLKFNMRHSNSLSGWVCFCYRYTKLMVKSTVTLLTK